MLVLQGKERASIEKVNSRWFFLFLGAILVHQNGTPLWHNSETLGHEDLRLGQIVYIYVFYNISFSWLLPLDGFQLINFFVA